MVVFGSGLVWANDPFDFDRTKENADFNFDELSGKLSLRFYDAVSGKPIPNAKLTLRGRTEISDQGGKVSFPFPKIVREEGIEKVHFEKKGYVTCDVEIHILLNSVFIHRYSISPSLPPGRYRITVDWADNPKDLDAHLIKRGRYHISFRDMKKYEDLAWLDRDDIDGEGPETVTVSRLDPNGHYVYYVHDYTHRADANFSGLEKSKAHVMVFNDNGVVESFRVSGGKGRVWRVFEIKDGSIVKNSGIVDRIH
jgi:hypothetical protein